MRLSEILKRVFITRTCAICGEAISWDIVEPFCEECKEYWKELLSIKCRKCGRTCRECTCLPVKVKKISHSTACWCVFYDAEENGEMNKLFFRMKRGYNRSIIDFCAERMKKSIIGVCKSRGISYREFVVTYAPRRRKSVYEYGFDQSEKLAKAIAKKLGIKMIPMFKNVGVKEQKGLNKSKRAENALSSYEYIKGSLGENKNVFIVDDIMTSGATLFACSFRLYENGAHNVVPVTFAKDNYKIKGEKSYVKRNSKHYFTGIAKGFMRNGS